MKFEIAVIREETEIVLDYIETHGAMFMPCPGAETIIPTVPAYYVFLAQNTTPRF
jgi:hypothetical protein